MDTKQLTEFSSIEEILTYAMNEEQDAYDYYIAAANRTADPELKTFLIELAEMEVDHYNILKKKLEECKANEFCFSGIRSSFDDNTSS